MKIIFITREGRREPGARMRCFGFSEKLKGRRFDSSVFSFADKLGAKSGIDEAGFGLKDKLRCIFKGYNLLSHESPNSVFIVNRFNYHSIPAWLVSVFKNIPVVFDMDDWEAREGSGSKAEYLTRLLAKRSVFCIAASHYLKDYLSQFNENVYCIPTPVDTGRFKPSSRREGKEFVFSWHGSVNRIEIISYIKLIIECFLSLYKKYPFIKLYIAGDGFFAKELNALISGYSCKAVICRGWVDYESMPRYLDEVDCGLVPLPDKTRFNLSKSPVKLFEYMAKAKPVVASPVGEAARIIEDGHNGFLACGKDEFALKMERLILNRAMGRQVGLAAREEVQNDYSLNLLGDRFAGLLKGFFDNSAD